MQRPGMATGAISFTDRGGRITTWCEIDRAHGSAFIHVSDTGCGIVGVGSTFSLRLPLAT